MPVKPENLHRYPGDWPAIRAAMMERARYRCEHHDAPAHRCGAAQYALGHWRTEDLWRLPVGFESLQRQVLRWFPLQGNHPASTAADNQFDNAGYGSNAYGSRWTHKDAADFRARYWAPGDEDWPTLIVLTCAHLDHQPENCDPANLRMFCQRHHLSHDADHHRATAQATRRARSGTPDLFAETAAP